MPLCNIDHEFISISNSLSNRKSCAQNTTVKYLKNLKKIITLALTNKWMTDNPFSGIRFKQTQSNREFLSEEELHIIMEKKFNIPRLEIVRDILFLLPVRLAYLRI